MIKQGLREAEKQFHRTPHDWKNDLNFFRLGHLCGVRRCETEDPLPG